MQSETPTAGKLDPHDRGWIADLYCLWALCGRAACRKARACRGRPPQCLRRHMPLVPEPAREWIVALWSGRDDGLDFDAALARIPPEVQAAYDAWCEAAQASTRPPAREDAAPQT
jgi:hypothetical protein